MRLRFLGTSAAGGFPNPHCRCANCEAARAEGGRSLRRQTSALINDDLLIDLGPDVLGAVQALGIHLGSVGCILQTHPHEDHLLPLHARVRIADWAAKDAVPLRWCGGARTLELAEASAREPVPRLAADEPMRPEHGKLALTLLRPWQEVLLGEYRVQTVAANHDPTVDPMLFAIEWRGRRLFWGADTSALPEDTWPRLAALGWRFDVAVFDHDQGFAAPLSASHMGSAQVRAEATRMRELGLLGPASRVIGTHLGHHSHGPHSVEESRAREHGYELAWDGMIVEV